jgi:hypothetical protein
MRCYYVPKYEIAQTGHFPCLCPIGRRALRAPPRRPPRRIPSARRPPCTGGILSDAPRSGVLPYPCSHNPAAGSAPSALDPLPSIALPDSRVSLLIQVKGRGFAARAAVAINSLDVSGSHTVDRYRACQRRRCIPDLTLCRQALRAPEMAQMRSSIPQSSFFRRSMKFRER